MTAATYDVHTKTRNLIARGITRVEEVGSLINFHDTTGIALAVPTYEVISIVRKDAGQEA